MDPGLALLLRRIDQAPIVEGNRVEIFFGGDQAFAAMQAAIESAREQVLVESYIWKDDQTGHVFREALGRAAARGVAVRVLADAFGFASDEALRETRWRAGFPHTGIERFSPFPNKPQVARALLR